MKMELLARTCNTERMNVERIAARGFVIIGGLFWTLAAFSGSHWTRFGDDFADMTPAKALTVLAVTVALFALAMFYEVLTSVVLFVAAAVSVAWGLVAGWEPGLWMIILIVLTAPMAIAGLLFLLAARMQTICTLEGHLE